MMLNQISSSIPLAFYTLLMIPANQYQTPQKTLTQFLCLAETQFPLDGSIYKFPFSKIYSFFLPYMGSLLCHGCSSNLSFYHWGGGSGKSSRSILFHDCKVSESLRWQRDELSFQVVAVQSLGQDTLVYLGSLELEMKVWALMEGFQAQNYSQDYFV